MSCRLGQVRVDRGELGGQWLGGGRVDELDGGVDAGVGVHPAGDRVEEGLRQLGVGISGQPPGVGTVGRAPQGAIEESVAEPLAQLGEGSRRGRRRRGRAARPSPAAPRASPPASKWARARAVKPRKPSRYASKASETMAAASGAAFIPRPTARPRRARASGPRAPRPRST